MTNEVAKRQEQLTGGEEPRRTIVLQTLEQLEEVYGKGILSKL